MTADLEPKTWYYYYRDAQRRPVVTVCLMEFAGNYYRGVALCSLNDHPIKAQGRAIAKGRATRALLWDRKVIGDFLPMQTERARSVWGRVSGYFWKTPELWGSKAQPECRLTDFERKLAERKHD